MFISCYECVEFHHESYEIYFPSVCTNFVVQSTNSMTNRIFLQKVLKKFLPFIGRIEDYGPLLGRFGLNHQKV